MVRTYVFFFRGNIQMSFWSNFDSPEFTTTFICSVSIYVPCLIHSVVLVGLFIYNATEQINKPSSSECFILCGLSERYKPLTSAW